MKPPAIVLTAPGTNRQNDAAFALEQAGAAPVCIDLLDLPGRRGEIERAKNKLATEVTLHGERSGGRMRELGGQWTYLGQYTSLPEEIERIMAVTLDDVRTQLRDTPFNPRTIVRLGPA